MQTNLSRLVPRMLVPTLPFGSRDFHPIVNAHTGHNRANNLNNQGCKRENRIQTNSDLGSWTV